MTLELRPDDLHSKSKVLRCSDELTCLSNTFKRLLWLEHSKNCTSENYWYSNIYNQPSVFMSSMSIDSTNQGSEIFRKHWA